MSKITFDLFDQPTGGTTIEYVASCMQESTNQIFYVLDSKLYWMSDFSSLEMLFEKGSFELAEGPFDNPKPTWILTDEHNREFWFFRQDVVNYLLSS